MLEALFVLDSKGFLLQKEYKAGTDYRRVASAFFQARCYAVSLERDALRAEQHVTLDRAQPFDDFNFALKLQNPNVWFAPLVFIERFALVSKHANDLCVLGVASRNDCSAGALMKTLDFATEVIAYIAGSLSRGAISNKFVAVNLALDEAVVGGELQQTDLKLLSSMLGARAAESGTTPMNSAIAWRANSVKHRKNEIYVDVVESFSATLGPNGAALESGVSGVVRMKSFLSGLPELKLGLFFAQPPAQLRAGLSSQDAARSASRADLVECVKSDKLQELRFHPCVRLNRFRAEKQITFIPPDGEFDLLSYSIRREHLADVPFTVTCQHLHNTLDPDAVAFELVVRLRANFAERITARFVKVIVPTPSDISKPKTKPSGGSAHYTPSLDAVVWHLSLLTGGEQRELSIKAARSRLGREAFKTWTRSPLRLEFEIPFFTASNLRVEYLRIAESSGYLALPWVRYLTNSKDYEVRAF